MAGTCGRRWWERLDPKSLRFDLTALVALAGIPALALATVLAVRDRAQDVARAEEEVHHAAQVAVRDYERRVREAEGVLLGVSESSALRIGGPECDAFLARVLAHTDLAVLGVAHPDGTVFCSALPLSGPVNLADRQYVHQALVTRQFSVGGVHVGRISGLPSVGVALPVVEDDGSVSAVVFGGLAVDRLGDAFGSVELPAGARALVLDQGGVAVAVFPASERRWVGTDTSRTELFRVATARRDGISMSPGFEGTTRLFGFTQLETGGPGLERLTVVVGIPLANVVRGANQRFAFGLAGVAGIVVIALLGTRRLATVRIVRRVDALLATTARLSAGDLSARTGFTHHHDEIGRLAGGLDGMAASLEHAARTRDRLEAELRQAHKLEAVGRLAGGVAHDFNNLLTAILSYGRFLKEDLAPDDPRQEDVAEILRAAERAAGLTRQLLAFGRRQSTAPEVLELNPLVAEAERMLHRLLGGNVALVLRQGADVPPVLADGGQLEQVVVNLVVNARDALPRGGTVIVETGREVRAPKRGGDPRPHAVLAVIDDGIGMDDETRSHLFEPFFTTKAPGKGTGLGLATVFGIVDRAGGTIEVETAPGRGTAVRVLLPAADDPVERTPARAAALPAAPRAAGETVLVVDDDDAVRAPIRRILDAHGFRTLEARDAAEALIVARSEVRPIDLLVTDLRMPGASGLELARGLRAERPGLGVLLVSGHADRAEIPPDVAFLEKPFAPEVLAARAHSLLDSRRA